jgi:hypothetical protein
MFVVSEAEADAIRAAFVQRGELSAAIELRRLFPGITDNVQALACARTIAGWKPLPTTKPRSVKFRKPAIVTVKRRRSRFGDVPDMTLEEYQWRGEAADALFREIVRRATE